jgi:photosystem II stability/assembly factor-like uncharacterized protein
MRNNALFALLILAAVGLIVVGRLLLPQSDVAGEWKLLHKSELIHGSRISHVKFFDKNNGIIISPGFIARSSDGGKQFAHVESSEKNGYYSFAFADNRRGIAVGSVNNEAPLALRTIDAGISWQTLNFDPKLLNGADIKITTFLDVCFDPTGTIWIVGNKGIVGASVEENKLNIANVYSTTEVLYSVACAENGQIWAVGQDSVLHNSGNGWQRKQLDRGYYFGRVKSIGKEIWLLGGIKSEANSDLNSGILLRSNNSGGTWENKTPKSGGLSYDIFLIDGTLWLIGEGGQIHYSRDNGDSWVSFPSPSNADLLSIYFLNNQNGWITGERGTVLAYSQ